MEHGVVLTGRSFSVDPGAVIDVSGGGTLAGAAFVSGRGGSTDPMYHPLPRFDPPSGQFELPTLDARPVYAILPGLPDRYAPLAPRDASAGYAGSRPLPGETITIGAGVPGLAAGTYTLLPAYYALLPGAFRVEVGANAQPFAPVGLRGGSWTVTATRGLAGTGTGDGWPRQALITPGDVLRRHAQYNEMDYQAYVLADATRKGLPRAWSPQDVSALELRFLSDADSAGATAFRFEGAMRANRGAQGYGGQVIVRADQPLEIVKDGATPGFLGASVRAADINALGADRISIGGSTAQSSISPDRLRFDVRGDDIYLRSGALLRAPEVLLMTSDTKSIVVERGAIINTLGMGAAPYDSRNGYRYGQSDSSVNVLAVSNGWLDFANGVSSQEAGIELGADCAVAACAAPARLYSDGTIAIGTSNLIVHDALRYGTRNLVLAANSLNVGNEAALADAAARGVLPPGLRLSQTLLSRLLIGDREMGAPALSASFSR